MTYARKGCLYTFAIIVCLAPPLMSQPVPNLLRWSVTSAEEDSVSAGPRSVRLFQGDVTLVLAFSFFNQSPVDLVVAGEQFTERASIRVALDGRQVPVDIQWADVVRPARASSDLSARVIELAQNQGVLWNARLTRRDGEPFHSGSYEIDIDLSAAKSALTTSTGEPFSGHVVPRNTLTLTIAEPADASEQAERLGKLALLALVDQRSAEAEVLYLKALALKPDDTGLLAYLANAYVQQSRYREAITILERILPRIRGFGRNVMPGVLAMAYVGIGDETNAARVLKMEGRSDADTASELVRLREVVKRRAERK